MLEDQLDDSSQQSNDYPVVGREAVLKKIFHGFAENLPNEKESKEKVRRKILLLPDQLLQQGVLGCLMPYSIFG
jgi:hypothetical protein